VIAFVEARRVLYASYPEEMPSHCITSAIEIRNFLTDVIGTGGIADQVANPLRIMRRYCILFLSKVGQLEEEPQIPNGTSHRLFMDRRRQVHDYVFGEALGELRSGMGLQIAILAAGSGVDVEESLASFLPPAP
jgi:hypothetical protein